MAEPGRDADREAGRADFIGVNALDYGDRVTYLWPALGIAVALAITLALWRSRKRSPLDEFRRWK